MPAPDIAALLHAAFPEALDCAPHRLNDIPRHAGAYALILPLAAPLQLLRPVPALLPAGVYLYAGSANGPGGLHARLNRHFRPEKKPHWHIDQLLPTTPALSALAIVGGNECAIIARLEKHGATHPLPGFGSTDCPHCRSHLMKLAGET